MLITGYKKNIRTVLFIIILAIPVSLTAQQKNLDYFIEQGLQNSPLIKEANNNILLNRIDSLRILASYKTQVSGISNNYYAPIIHGYGYDEIITNIRNFSEQISATKTFVGKRNLQIQFNGIQLLNDSLSIAGKITEQDLRRTITAAYVAAYGSWRQYNFNNEIYNLLSTEDTILKKLTQASVYRQTDYLTFLVTLQQQHLTITQAKQQFQNDYATLNYLCGLIDTSFSPLDSPHIALSQLPEYNNSIFYRKFITDSLLLKNASQQIGLAYKPKLSFTADGGYVSSLTYTPYKNFGVGAAVNLTIPIYDGNQRRLQYQRLNILEQTRINNRDFYTAQYQQQIAQLTQQLQTTNQIINETNDQLKYVHTLMNANRKLLITGDVRIADYIIAISNYLNAQNTITQNIIKQFQLITQINYWNK
ncbi:MAG TPA: TolC family protein [Parafilimonas sp.]|nr:TolC family protein [Parafilimonas sp.]